MKGGWLRGAALCGLALACGAANAKDPVPSGSPSAAGYQPMGRDEQGLWAQVDEVERDLKASKLIIRDPEILGYLRTVVCRVAGEDHCGSARIYLVRNAAFNAGMYPNGMMVVNTGLLLRSRDEAQLAAVLGHEFGHFELRHGLEGHRNLRNALSWGAWLSVISGGAGYGQNLTAAFLAAHFKFSRDQEHAADLAGISYMGAHGYRTSAAGDVWAQLREEEDAHAAALGVRSKKDAYRGPFASHPIDAERMLYLREAAKTTGAANSFEGRREYRQAIAPLWPMLIDDQIKLNDFGASEYLLKNLADGDWSGPLLFARGELYRSRGQPGDFAQAIEFYRAAAVLPDAPAGTWRGLGLALARAGDSAGAKTAIAEFLRRNPDAPDKSMLAMIGESE